MALFERFTERARRVVVLQQPQVKGAGHLFLRDEPESATPAVPSFLAS